MAEAYPGLHLDGVKFPSRQQHSYSPYRARPVMPVRARLVDDIVRRPNPTRPQATQPVAPVPPTLTKPQPIARESKPALSSPKQRRLTQPRLLIGLAAVLFVVGIGVSLTGLRTNRQTVAQVKALSHSADQTGATDVPDETPPNTTNYNVAPDLPRYLRIPKLNVQARVKRTDVDANNQLRAPANIFDAGWYAGSSKPGEAGATLIEGHVHGPTQPGIFIGLKKLVPGDQIDLERGDGKVLSYKVVKSQSYSADKVDMASALVSVDTSKPGLNLITCTGKIKSGTTDYEDRLIVFAVQK